METTQYFEELKNRFSTYSGNSFDICADIAKYIDAAPSDIHGDLFALACKSFNIVKSNRSYAAEPSGISKSKREEMKDIYGEIIDTLLATDIKIALKKGYSENEFYQTVWKNIVCNPLFSDEDQRVFTLYYVLIDKRVPFFTIAEGLEMENEDYRECLKECSEDVLKIKFILAVDFEQKTQEASNLLDVILKKDTYEKQVALLAKTIAELRFGSNRLLTELLEKIKD